MKLLRYLESINEAKYGIVQNNLVYDIDGNIFTDFKVSNTSHQLSKISLLPPVLPSKIIALGYNYKDLVGEKENYDEPIIFIKPNSSVIGPNDYIILKENKKTWLEVELAIVIKKVCSNISESHASDYILGYTIANDVTMDNILQRDHHLARSKGWDTFCPIGPFIETELITDNLEMISKINGKIFQKSSTKNRILNDSETLKFVSNILTLYPGDIIITGTPANAEYSIIKDSDDLELYIEGIGTLINHVKYIGA